MTKKEKNNKIAGCLIGLATGDAFGAPYEFQKIEKRITKFPTHIGPHGERPGVWTDDTSMTLCLLDSCIRFNGFNKKDQLRTYNKWYTEGYLSSTSKAIGLGRRTVEALGKFKTSRYRIETYEGDPNSQGNGSLMRVAAIPLFLAKHPVIKNHTKFQQINWVGWYAKDSSRTTHDTEMCRDACYVFSLMIHKALLGKSKEEVFKFTKFQLSTIDTQSVKDILLNKTYKNKEKDIIGDGYVLNSLNASLWAFYNSDSYRQTILKSVNLGKDTDTTACIAGALAGAFYGLDSIPKNWQEKLVKRDLLDLYVNKLTN